MESSSLSLPIAHEKKGMRSVYILLLLLLVPTVFVQARNDVKQNSSGFCFQVLEVVPSDTVKTISHDSVSFMEKLDSFNKMMETIVQYSPLPVVSYSSVTDWLFGLTKINSFRLGTKDQSDTTIQPSTITALAYYTMNKQFKFVVGAKLMFGQNKYQSQTALMFINFPEFYFGVGNNTKATDSCLVATKNYAVTQGLSYKFMEKWYAGIKYKFNNYIKVDTVAGDFSCNIDVSDLPENQGAQSGIGLMISREARDNRFNARKGSYLYFEYMNFGKWIGSSFAYNSLVIEYNKYVSPLKWLTVAAQVYTEAKFGNVPIQSLARMGGANQMRGLYDGRFRDHTMLTGQVELRFPIFWIFGGTIFTGIGEVGPNYSAYTWDGIKWTYGLGLRLMVYEPTRTNLRFDVGFFEEHPLFFFTFSEAF